MGEPYDNVALLRFKRPLYDFMRLKRIFVPGHLKTNIDNLVRDALIQRNGRRYNAKIYKTVIAKFI